MTFDEVFNRISETHRKSKFIVGCSEAQVNEVEEAQGTVLPELYRGFLRTMGCSRRLKRYGTDFFYPEVLGSKQAAREILDDNEHPFDLPESAVVIGVFEYQFLFIDGAIGDDPPVHRYVEGDSDFVTVADRLSTFLLRRLVEFFDRR